MLMNVAIIEKDRDVIVFMLCASNMCSQQDGWPETRSPSRQRAISTWCRSGDHALQCKYKAVVMFLLIGGQKLHNTRTLVRTGGISSTWLHTFYRNTSKNPRK